MLTVKLSHPFGDFPLLRQTPRGSGEWGGCRFLVNQDVRECDFWVVLEGLKQPERTRCPAGNTLLVTTEPPTIKSYLPGFAAQFGAVLTCHRDLTHPRAILGQQGLPWHAGLRVENHRVTAQSLGYDEFAAPDGPAKTRELSIVASNKRGVEGQARRMDFMLELGKRLGGRLDAFGRGIREVPDKWDALADYRYHIAIENSAIPDYFTEKITDAFLAGCFVFYHGCTNIADYFPAGSLQAIDIADADKAAADILAAIDSGAWERGREDIAQARRLVLDRYNIFAELARLCPELARGGRAEELLMAPENAFTCKGLLRKVAGTIKRGLSAVGGRACQG